eukprot:5547584-Lingulodinium_polyedra.AAC.1
MVDEGLRWRAARAERRIPVLRAQRRGLNGAPRARAGRKEPNAPGPPSARPLDIPPWRQHAF